MQGIVDEERQRDHPQPPSARRVATGRPCLGCCSCSPLKGCRTKTSRSAWTPRLRSSVNGANGSSNSVLPGWKTFPEEAAPAVFPVEVMIQIKALACELPYRRGLPLSRFSMSEIKREAISQGLVASIGQTTVWRWLSQDAIKPWNHRSWIFPRDPRFREKGARILDLYAGRWQQKPLLPSDCVLCADEKTSIQARRRCRPGPGWGSGHAGGTRISTQGSLGLSGGLGHPASSYFWPLRAQNRDRALRPARRPGHGPAALSFRLPRLLDTRQRLFPPGTSLRRQTPESLEESDRCPYTGSCQLAKSNRDLLLHLDPQGTQTQPLRLTCRTENAHPPL